MPRIPMEPENKSENPSDYPRLSLDRGERARVLLIEREPEFAFTHTLKMPSLGPDGRPVMVQVTGRDGESREEMDMEFKGRHLCLGALDVVQTKGLDPDNCPECREAFDGGGAIPVPERRFALNIVRYSCRPGTFEVNDVFQVSVLAWTFNDKVFGKLVDKKGEWGDLLLHDLLLGPCESKQYQKFDIEVAREAAWLSDAVKGENGQMQLGQRGQLVQQAYNAQKSKDLTGIIGRKVTKEQMEEDLAVVLRRWRQARGGPASPNGSEATSGEVVGTLDLQGLLGGGVAAPAAVEAAVAVEAAPVIAVPAEPGVPVDLAGALPQATESEPEVVGTLELDDLLKDIQ